jgi:YfiH family protein
VNGVSQTSADLDLVHPAWAEPERLPSIRAYTTTALTDLSSVTLPSQPHWLKQVHGREITELKDWQPGIKADAAWTDQPGQVIAIQTADCLPILMVSTERPLVAGVHAGWRGLALGVIEHSVRALPVDPASLHVWIGPAICADHFEVGEDVLEAFVHQELAYERYFMPGRVHHWQADLVGLATHQLNALGVGSVVSCGLCTAHDPERFFSYRRGLPKNQETARMASLIWLESVTMGSRTNTGVEAQA